ncbi:glycoside hydrolase family 25 protein [Streptomyces sp. P17]|uniref:glycoside hydrolase family 25 protein n=1 Tax=Streptomyces sp. P17 TaxID=3074716 RepID=UPI0028F438A7|nr:glycoside hydrolase family 25 protein [Streptomyces sp. P17]MDT9695372.1 glycoside hydrolase family 25 protein [Streptomyces sp. P17]
MPTCRGVDVSGYQGPQDWAAHKQAGVVFAWVKASEGQRSRDARFDSHIGAVIKAGLVPGAYHFAWPNQDAVTEANNYIGVVKPYASAGDFVHWLDLERYPDGRNYAGRTSAQIRAWAETWIARVQAAFPRQRVGVYTSADDIAKGHLPPGVPLWYPAYPWGPADYSRAEGVPQPKTSGRTPLFWQFTSQPMDRNICYLSAAGLRAWAAGDKEDDMALSAEDKQWLKEEIGKVAPAVWQVDDIPAAAPPYNNSDYDTNKTWSARYALGDAVLKPRQVRAELAELAAKVDSLAVGGVDLDALAAKVADLLAARLAE